jgi:aminoglycoside phosphotransferase
MPVRSTHAVEVVDDRVTKRFRSWDRGEHQREWRALNLLAEFAPGLAPAPIGADLDAEPPVIAMTRVPGEPLAGQPVTARHLDALAAALNQLHACVPIDALTRVPPHPWLAEDMANLLRSLFDGPVCDTLTLPVQTALSAASDWLDDVAEPAEPPTSVSVSASVFGQGDGSLSNFLWDGQRVRIVDFEDSGRSDRAFELACLTEHISTWYESGIDAADLLDRFGLTVTESARVLFFRRAFASYWLHVVCQRPGPVAVRQARRLLGLLNT